MDYLSGFIDSQSKAASGNTFQAIADTAKAKGEFSQELDRKSEGKRTWTTIFAIGALATSRKAMLGAESPEHTHLNKIIDGLKQGWVEDFGGLSLSGVWMNDVAINKLLDGMKGWVNDLEPNKPNPEEYNKTVIAAAALINVLETKLIENKSKVEAQLPMAFTALDDIKRTLMLKNPQLALSILKEDNHLLSKLLSEQPAIALNLFLQNPSLISSLSPMTRVPEVFANLLAKNPESALSLIKSTDKDAQDFIVSALLKNNPKHIETLITIAPDSVKNALKDRSLVQDVQTWQKSEEAQQHELIAVNEFMAPFQGKTTADILAKPGAAPDLHSVLKSLKDKYEQKETVLLAKKSRLEIFSAITNQPPLNTEKFWKQYPNHESLIQLLTAA